MGTSLDQGPLAGRACSNLSAEIDLHCGVGCEGARERVPAWLSRAGAQAELYGVLLSLSLPLAFPSPNSQRGHGQSANARHPLAMPAALPGALAWGRPRDTHSPTFQTPVNNGSLSPPELVPMLGTVPSKAESEWQQCRGSRQGHPSRGVPFRLHYPRSLGKVLQEANLLGGPRAPAFPFPGHRPFRASANTAGGPWQAHWAGCPTQAIT